MHLLNVRPRPVLSAGAVLQALPFLKYLIYTPSFHSLHHSRVVTNFCLFMCAPSRRSKQHHPLQSKSCSSLG
jgi:hypothetical protein